MTAESDYSASQLLYPGSDAVKRVFPQKMTPVAVP